MSGKRYPEEFKIEAVKQVVDRGHSIASVATRLDITTHSLYAWVKKYGPDSSATKTQPDAQSEIRRLQKGVSLDIENYCTLSLIISHIADNRCRYSASYRAIF